MFTKGTVYEGYAYFPCEAFHTLWLCKTKETAEYLLMWEQACLYDYWYDNKELFGGITWEQYELQCAPEFKMKEVDLFD